MLGRPSNESLVNYFGKNVSDLVLSTVHQATTSVVTVTAKAGPDGQTTVVVTTMPYNKSMAGGFPPGISGNMNSGGMSMRISRHGAFIDSCVHHCYCFDSTWAGTYHDIS